MSDTMPERCCQSYKCDICHTVYVPEQRALDAEAMVEHIQHSLNNAKANRVQTEASIAALRAERDALQSDLKALLERVSKAEYDLREVGGYDNEMLGIPAGGVRSFITVLRAILDREGV